MSDEDVWMLVALCYGLGIFGCVAIHQIYNRMQLPRSQCPGCGRWKRELYYSYMDDMSFFECRKCGMTWRDTPPNGDGRHEKGR